MKILKIDKRSLIYFFSFPVLIITVAILLNHPFFINNDSLFYLEIYAIIIAGGLLLTITFNYFEIFHPERFRSVTEKSAVIFYLFPAFGWMLFFALFYISPANVEPASSAIPAQEQVSESNDDPDNAQYSTIIDNLDSSLAPPIDVDQDEQVTEIEQEILAEHSAKPAVAFEVDLDSNVPMTMQFLRHVRDQLVEHMPQQDLPNQQQYMMLGQDLSIAMSENDWERFEELVAQNRGDIEEIDTIALNLLLMNENPPQALVEQYVSTGALVVPTMLTNQLASGNYDTLTKLENYGVNVFGGQELGVTLLDFALMQSLEREAFDFASNRTQEIGFKEYLGTDSVGIVLANATQHGDQTGYFISQLVQNGAQITPQHRQMLEKLMTENPTLASKIKTEVPDLY